MSLTRPTLPVRRCYMVIQPSSAVQMSGVCVQRVFSSSGTYEPKVAYCVPETGWGLISNVCGVNQAVSPTGRFCRR
jgi:hypothetical protein